VGEDYYGEGWDGIAVGELRDGTPVVIAAGGYENEYAMVGMVEVYRLKDAKKAGNPFADRHRTLFLWDSPVNAVAVGALRNGTPVIVAGGWGGDMGSMIGVWQLADGYEVGLPWVASSDKLWALATGALPDGTPVIISSGDEGTIDVWRLAKGTRVGAPLTGHHGGVKALAVGALPDGTPVIISGGYDGTVRAWRLADGTPATPPLELPGPVESIAVEGNVIVTVTWADITVHELAQPPSGNPDAVGEADPARLADQHDRAGPRRLLRPAQDPR
jgi:WD40 repeat protein